MALNLQPYPISKVDDLTYSFTTEKGDSYKCFFLSYSEYFVSYPELARKIYSFNIELTSPPALSKSIDRRIADTVIQIVGDFLSSRVNAVVYVCDPTDGKGAARARKFKSWYNYYEYSTEILQLNTDMEAGGIRLYTAFLVHKKNKLKHRFIQAYLDLVDAGEEK
ncbi:MAG TPA: DUF6169 family protein [Niabella sp.]|nr:DUF6169 family protein [Niabella sp.]